MKYEKKETRCWNNVFQLNDVKEKRKDTLLKTLGVDIPMKSEKCVQQYKLTARKRCGKDHSMQTEEGKTRYKETCLRLYGENWYSKTDLKERACYKCGCA